MAHTGTADARSIVRAWMPVEDPAERAMHTAYDVLDTFQQARLDAAGHPARLHQLRERLETLVQMFHQESTATGDAEDACR